MYKPYLNIIYYYGCLIKCGYIISIVLDQYSITLKERLENVIQDFNINKFINRLTSTVYYFYLLKLAHNDLCLINIMIDKVNNNILAIIDFGSCQPFGCKLITTDTPEWINKNLINLAWDYNNIALDKI